MSYTHRHGEELRKLDEQYTRNAPPMSPAIRVVFLTDGVPSPGSHLYHTWAEVEICVKNFLTRDPKRHVCQLDWTWA